MEVSLRCHNSPRRYWVTRCGLIKRFRTWTRSSYVFLRFLFFIYSIVMNITCLFCTWPYSCIWLHNIDIFGARTWAYRSWYGFRLGYHGSTKTIREAAKNKEESISERPRKIRNKEKRPKTRRTNSAPPERKRKMSSTEKRRTAQPQKKKKEGVKRKEIKEVTQFNSKKKKKRHEEKKKNKKVFAHLRLS